MSDNGYKRALDSMGGHDEIDVFARYRSSIDKTAIGRWQTGERLCIGGQQHQGTGLLLGKSDANASAGRSASKPGSLEAGS